VMTPPAGSPFAVSAGLPPHSLQPETDLKLDSISALKVMDAHGDHQPDHAHGRIALSRGFQRTEKPGHATGKASRKPCSSRNVWISRRISVTALLKPVEH